MYIEREKEVLIHWKWQLLRSLACTLFTDPRDKIHPHSSKHL